MLQLRNLRQLGRLAASADFRRALFPVVCDIPSSGRMPTAPPSYAFIHTTCCASSASSDSSGLQMNRRLRRENYYKRLDHIAEGYHLIYRNPMEYTIAGCQHLSTFSLAITAACLAYKCAVGQAIVDVTNLQLNIGPLMSDADEMLWFGVAFVGFNVTLLYACSRLPLRIYRNENRYVAMFEGLVPMKARPYPFVAGELSEAFKSVLPWKEAMYKMRSRSVLLLAPYFKTPSELNAMLQEGVPPTSTPSSSKMPRKY